MNYAPEGKPSPVVEKGAFPFAAVALDHGHIYGQCKGLTEAGGDLKYVYDPDPAKVEKFCKTFPGVEPLASVDAVLEKPEIKLVAAAAVPNERGPLGLRVMEAGKDYFTDKTPFTTLGQLAAARARVQTSGKKYMVYYSERLHVECAVRAGQLIEQGAIGRVVQVVGLGPHRCSPGSRPAWFWSREKTGHSRRHRLASVRAIPPLERRPQREGRPCAGRQLPSQEFPEFEDWGEANLVADNGSTNYIRIDWLNPDGLSTWGDGRAFILGTAGYIELRKYVDVARETEGDQLYLVDHKGEHHIRCHGEVGYPYFGQLILDCLNRTENAMTQEHVFLAAQLCLEAQAMAKKIE